MTKNIQKNNTAVIIAIFFILIACLLLAIWKCPNKIQIILISSLLSLAASMLAVLITGKLDISIKWQKNTINATAGFGMFLLVFFGSPQVIEDYKACTEPFSITIFTHGKNGIHDIVLRNNGIVVVDIKNDRKTVKINEQGFVVVLGIPSNYQGTRAPIYVDANTFQTAHKDSLYLLEPNGNIYIKLKRKNLDKAKGFVKNEVTGEPIEGARVTIGSLPPTVSDTVGYFEINIPETEQDEKKTITIQKTNFKTISDPITINSNKEMRFPLTPISKHR